MASLSALVGGFFSDLKDGLIGPKGLVGKASTGVGRALAFYVVLAIISCLLSAMVSVIPVALTAAGGGMDSAFKDLPDFKISNGKFAFVGDVKQPYKIAPNFVIDTTGQVTDVPVDASGEGILITEDAMIQKTGLKEEKTLFKDMGKMDIDKQKFIGFMNTIMLAAIPLVLVFSLIGNAIWYTLVCGLLSLVYLGAATLIKKMEALKGLTVALYAQAPILCLGVLTSAIGGYIPYVGGLPITLASVLWSIAVMALALNGVGKPVAENA